MLLKIVCESKRLKTCLLIITKLKVCYVTKISIHDPDPSTKLTSTGVLILSLREKNAAVNDSFDENIAVFSYS